MKKVTVSPEIVLVMRRVIKNAEVISGDRYNVRTEDIYNLLTKDIKELCSVLPELLEYQLDKKLDIGIEEFGGHSMKIYTKTCLTKIQFIKSCCEIFLAKKHLNDGENTQTRMDGWNPSYVIAIVGIIITVLITVGIFIVDKYADYRYDSGLRDGNSKCNVIQVKNAAAYPNDTSGSIGKYIFKINP